MTTNGQTPALPVTGYYVFEPTTHDGRSLGRYGPYDLATMREYLYKLTDHLDQRTVDHAIAVTQAAPNAAFVLSDVREKKVNGEPVEYVAWTAHLTWVLPKPQLPKIITPGGQG